LNTARYIVVAALIVGLVLGAGVGYLSIPPVTKTVTETLTTTKTEFVTLTQTVVTVKEKTETVTETKTVTFTPPKPPASFTLLNYSVTVKADTPVLYVQFKTTAPLTLKLIGPDGVRKDSKEVYPGELGVYLELASPFETPIPGKYVLEATTYEGSVI